MKPNRTALAYWAEIRAGLTPDEATLQPARRRRRRQLALRARDRAAAPRYAPR